jgi:hypothetical protein
MIIQSQIAPVNVNHVLLPFLHNKIGDNILIINFLNLKRHIYDKYTTINN